MRKKIIILFILNVAAGICSLFIGVMDLAVWDIFNPASESARIFILSRIPRTISIICVGMSLSVSGIIMQLVMSNKMVSPSTASTMDWAKLGVLISVLLFPSAPVFVKMLVTAAFAFFGTLFFTRLIRLMPVRDRVFVPLLGIMLGGVVGSVTTFIAFKYNLVQNISSWLQGSFAMVVKGRYELLYFGIPMLFIAMLFADRFTIASMGQDFSSNLGISYESTVNIGLMIAALSTSVVVATIGTIPFVGLIIPNLVSLFQGDSLKKNIWVLALCGGLFLLLCDIFSRLIIHPFEIPISVTVGIIGGSIFLYLIFRRKSRASA